MVDGKGVVESRVEHVRGQREKLTLVDEIESFRSTTNGETEYREVSRAFYVSIRGRTIKVQGEESRER